MRELLEEKLKQGNFVFQDAEINWMLENIGVEDPEVRDELIYRLLTCGIDKETLTEVQFQYVAEILMERDLIFYQLDEGLPAVLTRTFTALQNGNLLEADGKREGRYFQLLTGKQRDYFFERALSYLEKEHVFEGCSEKYGWIHAFAHGADYLAAALAHQNFSLEQTGQALEVLQNVFYRLPVVFTFGEDRRLGEVVCKGILSGNLTQQQVATWLEQVNIPMEKMQDFQKLATFEVFLAYIYFHLFEKIELEDELKSVLLDYLREI